MERRHTKRKIVRLKAERISGGKTHAIFIENISEGGMRLITAPSRTSKDFPPDEVIDLRFQLASRDTLRLKCKVKWAYRIPPDGLTNSIGIEIIDPPIKYKEFIKKLS